MKISIKGMHCNSCVTLLSEEFSRVGGVHHTDISLKNNAAQIFYEGEEPLFDQLAARAAHYGYTVLKAGQPAETEQRRGRALASWALGAVVAALLLGAFALLQRSGLIESFSGAGGLNGVGGIGQLGLAFFVGIVASLSTCFAVVGALVIAFGEIYSSERTDKPLVAAFRGNALFHAGRLAAFFLFGGILGLIGGGLSLSGRTLSIIIIIYAVIMVVMGLSILGLGRLFRFTGLKMPPLLARTMERLKKSTHPLAPTLLGAITFFLPCGFTQSMQVVALGSGSFLGGAAVMLLFALGTLPVLFATGLGASWTRFKKVDFLRKAAGLLIIVFAVSTFLSATSLIDYQGNVFAEDTKNGQNKTDAIPVQNAPLPAKTKPQPGKDKALSQTDTKKDDAPSLQRIEMHVTARGFEPAVLNVKAGVPVQWVIFGDQVTGCTSRIIVPAYSLSKSIDSGENVVTFTPSGSGTIPFSCWMGMVRGVFVVE
jgi:sulfite exporter TauE/SafE/copper chaperone CopZ/plastocyanin